MATFPFAVLAPENSAFEGEVSQVSLRTEGGDIGLLAGHIPFIGAVEVCVCEITREDGGTERVAVHGGFVEVDPEGSVALLAAVAERAEDIDVARARRAAERAAERASEDDDDARAALARAEVRLAAAGQSR
jgi:F-type H+-transporting ATPase subunit epsilon